MADEEAVFIVGIGRSGTSALRTVLHRLPAFRAVKERSPETRIFAEPELIEHILDRRARRLFRYMLHDEAEAARLLESLASMQSPWEPLRRFRARHTSDRVRAFCLLGHRERVRVFFHHAQRARRAPRILEKTPHHWRFLEEIHATFPRARIVMCIRHPIDVMSSLRKRHELESARRRRTHRLKWMEVDAAAMAERFGEVARALAAQRATRPDRSFLLRYEDLTADPASVLARLCDFVGEPYDEAALLGTSAEERDAHGSPVQGSRIAANRKRWEQWVTPAEAAAVEEAVAAEMDAMGYARYTGS